jgi:hypothetical protein
MKRVIRIAMFLAIAAMAYVNESTAQVGFGANIGFNIAGLTPGIVMDQGLKTEFDESDALPGLNLSGFANFSFGKRIGLQPEIAFSMQGERQEEDGRTITHRLNYVNIPVLLDIKLKGLSIFVGPQFGFNVFRALKSDDVTISGSKYDDVMKLEGVKFNTVDYAAVVGLQYVIRDHFIVGARGSLGLQSVYASDRSGLSIISGYENQVFQISVGYKF